MNRPSAMLAGLATVVALLSATRAMGQDTVSITTDALELDVGGRLQTQFNTTSVDGQPDGYLFLRRARLELGVVATELVTGRFHVDFAGDRVSLKDAYAQLNFSPGFAVLAGKAYRPFSLLQNTSSVRALPIERGVAIRGVGDYDEYELVADLGYAERDIGVQVLGEPEGAPLGLTYQAGVFGGPPILGRPAGTGPYQFVGRLRVEPISDVQIGGAWSNRAFAPAAPGNTERGSAFELDLEVGGFDPGFHFLGEVTTGVFDPFLDADFRAAQGWLGYRTASMGRFFTIEPLVRLSVADIDDVVPFEGGTLFTPGINIYFDALNRVMLNYDFWNPTGAGESQGSFKGQVQLVF